MCKRKEDTCPVLSELISLQNYKKQAELRIKKLEQELARLNCCDGFPKHHLIEDDYQRSLRQLSAVESDFQNITTENISLKSKLKKCQRELDEWQHFGQSILTTVGRSVNYNGPFPANDSQTQRFILMDLVKKMCEGYQTGAKETPEYAQLQIKYDRNRQKLREVRRKCDKMLAIISERSFAQTANDCEKEQESKEALKDLGEHVKTLAGTVKEMKGDYRNWKCCKDKENLSTD